LVDNHFTQQYNPEDNSEHDTRRRGNLKSHKKSIPYMWTILEANRSILDMQGEEEVRVWMDGAF
jgi:hypothetical protein